MGGNHGLSNTRLLSIATVVTVIIVGMICSIPQGARAGNEKTVALVMKALSNPFFLKMETGAKEYAQQHQIVLEVFGVERETDVERQISIVENLISRGYGAIVIAPADSKGLVPVCKKALDANIVVINIDNPFHKETMAQAGISIPFVGPDNRVGANKVGAYIKHRLGGQGRILIIEGIRGVENAELRRMGFMESVTQDSRIEVVASETANWHTDEALSVSNALLEAHSDIDAIFCANDSMALGALQALDIAGKAGEVLVAGYDNIDGVRQEMQHGRVHATVEQHPELMGADGVRLAARALNGEAPPAFIATPVDLVTHESFGKKIAFSISNLANPFFMSLQKQAQNTARLHGMEMQVYDARNEDSQQLNDLTAILKEEIDALLINPTNTETVGLGIELANRKGVPVVTVDRRAAEGDVICHIASDNREGGKMAAQVLAKHMDGQGKIIELEGIPGTSAAQERGLGFNTALGAYPGIQIVAREVAYFSRSEAHQTVRRLLEGGLEFDGIFAHNDNMILGALDAMEDHQMANGKILIGFDGIFEARRALREGKLTATIVQRPENMGALAVESVVWLSRGETLEPYIRVELGIVEK